GKEAKRIGVIYNQRGGQRRGRLDNHLLLRLVKQQNTDGSCCMKKIYSKYHAVRCPSGNIKPHGQGVVPVCLQADNPDSMCNKGQYTWTHSSWRSPSRKSGVSGTSPANCAAAAGGRTGSHLGAVTGAAANSRRRS